jgi:Flp pilus assembly protein TadD
MVKNGLFPIIFSVIVYVDSEMSVKLNTMKRIVLFVLLLGNCTVQAEDSSFTNALDRADQAKKSGDISGALKFYQTAQQAAGGNAPDLCVLSKRYCDLTFLTNSSATQKDWVTRALACAQEAVKHAPQDAIAHASLAVCYAKSCTFADVKAELAYSRLFKQEAEKAIALDPRQDVAYYLLGRWNYGIAGAGFFARAYVKMIYGGLPRASYQDAVANFRKAVELAPDRILNHAGLAMAYEAMGEKKLEVAELEKCCALKPLGPEDVDARRDAQNKLAALRK